MRIFFAVLVLFLCPSIGRGSDQDPYMDSRQQMVDLQIKERGISDPHVLKAMMRVQRHLFVSQDKQHLAYEDFPLPIGFDQTISQPYIVAFMTQVAQLEVNDKVLEIGTGSGYQAAVLAEIVQKVFSIEIIKPLADQAQKRLESMGYSNIFIKHGDGSLGWPEHAPFDVIIVTAAPPSIPKALIDQLKVGGRMVLPVGTLFQELILITKDEKGINKKNLLPVRFVPMVNEN